MKIFGDTINLHMGKKTGGRTPWGILWSEQNREVPELCLHTHIGKWPLTDVMGAQIQTSDQSYEICLVHWNKSVAVLRQSLMLWTTPSDSFIYIRTQSAHWITINTSPKWAMLSVTHSLSESFCVIRWNRFNIGSEAGYAASQAL